LVFGKFFKLYHYQPYPIRGGARNTSRIRQHKVKLRFFPSGADMDWWRVLKIVGGLICVGGGLFSKEFKPIGWTTSLMWGRDEMPEFPDGLQGLSM
jgi:hypothetical protein